MVVWTLFEATGVSDILRNHIFLSEAQKNERLREIISPFVQAGYAIEPKKNHRHLKKIHFSLAMEGFVLYATEYSVIYELNKGVLTMDISKQEAQDSLDQIQTVVNHTRRTIASTYTSPLLILWGLIWIAAFMGSHFSIAGGYHLWTVLDSIGVICTFLICWRLFRSANPTKSPAARKFGLRIFLFWTLLFIYIYIWLSIVSPLTGLQLNAFICTAIMFAYIVKGLWLECYHLVWLGLVVTCTTLIGFYLIPPNYYCLWMAPTAGGAILGTGLYIRLFWK